MPHSLVPDYLKYPAESGISPDAFVERHSSSGNTHNAYRDPETLHQEVNRALSVWRDACAATRTAGPDAWFDQVVPKPLRQKARRFLEEAAERAGERYWAGELYLCYHNTLPPDSAA
jgi:hypothetical protein